MKLNLNSLMLPCQWTCISQEHLLLLFFLSVQILLPVLPFCIHSPFRFHTQIHTLAFFKLFSCLRPCSHFYLITTQKCTGKTFFFLTFPHGLAFMSAHELDRLKLFLVVQLLKQYCFPPYSDKVQKLSQGTGKA